MSESFSLSSAVWGIHRRRRNHPPHRNPYPEPRLRLHLNSIRPDQSLHQYITLRLRLLHLLHDHPSHLLWHQL